jgi:hypothetical protein
MALLTVPGGEARTMVDLQPTIAYCARRARRGGAATPRGVTAGYARPPAGQGTTPTWGRPIGRKSDSVFIPHLVFIPGEMPCTQSPAVSGEKARGMWVCTQYNPRGIPSRCRLTSTNRAAHRAHFLGKSADLDARSSIKRPPHCGTSLWSHKSVWYEYHTDLCDQTVMGLPPVMSAVIVIIPLSH